MWARCSALCVTCKLNFDILLSFRKAYAIKVLTQLILQTHQHMLICLKEPPREVTWHGSVLKHFSVSTDSFSSGGERLALSEESSYNDSMNPLSLIIRSVCSSAIIGCLTESPASESKCACCLLSLPLPSLTCQHYKIPAV